MQRYCALQAVEPKRASSTVRADPQFGHRTTFRDRSNAIGATLALPCVPVA
jgi:hypothetical protein